MKKTTSVFLSLAAMSLYFVSCQSGKSGGSGQDDFGKELQERFENAKKGDIIEIPEGKFELSGTLSLAVVNNVTLRGISPNKSVLSFRNHPEGTGGIKVVNSDNFILENLSLVDAAGGGVIVKESKHLIIRNVAVGWTNKDKSGNGKFGILSVLCKNVLIEKCAVTASSGGGIHISQSENVIVRENIISENVAGIEVENSIYVDVFKNKAFENTVGLFISDQPGLSVKNGHHVRIFENSITENNLPNFALGENAVAQIPAGTGLLLLSSREAEIFKNDFKGHKTMSAAILSFLIGLDGKPDSLFNPFTSSVFVHHNKFEQPMVLPDTLKPLGMVVYSLFQENNPHILFDGVIDPAFLDSDGVAREARNLCMQFNGDIKFADINGPSHYREIKTDPNVHNCEQGELPPVEFPF